MSKRENRLLTSALLKDLTPYPLGAQETTQIPDLLAVAVMRIGSIRWYIIEGSQEGDRFTFFTLVCGMGAEPELCYTDADELASVAVDCARYGFPGAVCRVEIDDDFTPCRLADLEDEDVQEYCRHFIASEKN